MFSALLTFGIVLMSFGIFWLMCFGVALCMLAAYFSSRSQSRAHRLGMFAVWVVAGVVFLVWDWHDGVTFVHRTPPLWFWILLAGAWLWNVVDEFYRWRKSRRLTDV
jgi:hypothetical protein